jgi:succinate dehydrogenase/fumarate reductase flavoprotein subunit
MVTNPNDLIDALELENLLLLADIEANVCLRRTESRGPHYREDFPHQDDENWLKSITVKKGGDGTPELGTLALDPTWRSKGDEGVKQWG